MAMIHVKHIIAPYESNNRHWAQRVAWMHKQLLDTICNEPIVISSLHTNIVTGLFGMPENERDHDRGQRSIMAATCYYAIEPDNELYVLLNDDGEPAPEVAAQERAWQKVRTETGNELNIFVGTWQQWIKRFI